MAASKANLLAVVLASAAATMLVSTAAPAFLMPGQPGAAPSSKLDQTSFRPMASLEASTSSSAQSQPAGVAAVVTMAATVGLAMGLLATPVNAEETSDSSNLSSRAARKARREAALKAEAKQEKAATSSDGGFSLPNPFAMVSSEAPKEAPKVVVSDDDRSPVASDPVALFLIFFTLPTIYLVFYVLGSIDVI
mmetsp:Transcript_10374/g.23435  ORF Transcript_10374/g.23435 Transcript_10374/m.23435 type:complete len:193 (-) Transcript_10374:109-687(-)|eukprot:CAMPEP_0178431604 /NCGR_PEP_ID=MMETSP0689_2-20121128/31940_1 /TAXON_ID=160604 /ORGANISM="Amphidinium massartii, Strain CS-259" /LENGTH=192 /DNA_ID=CAMNT_0020053535 /DNA_START=93 /DNA_END=671 /DNA_ORIENTATION=+